MSFPADKQTDNGTQLKFEEEQDYWEGSGEDLDMHGDEEEADMRAEEELMMQHRYMMVCPCHVFHAYCRCSSTNR